MSQLKIGVQLDSLRMPLKKALPILAEWRVRGIELNARTDFRPGQLTRTGIRQIRRWLEDYQLSVCAVSFQTRRGYDVLEDLQPRIEGTKAAMRLAYELGCDSVINQVGKIPEKDTPAFETLVNVLSELGRASHSLGAWLAMETGTESGPEMRTLLNTIPEGSVRVNFDPGNLIINSYSAVEAVDALGPYIVHVHAKDGVRDLAQGRGLEVPLGRGSADFPLLIGHLEEHNYRGYFTVEREQSRDPVHDIGLAVQYLRNLH